jgi:hypothetical protein
MAFTITFPQEQVKLGTTYKKLVGFYSNDGGSTGGLVDTKLQSIFNVTVTPGGNVVQNAPVIDSPSAITSKGILSADGTFTLVTDADTAGFIVVEGY